MQVFQGVQQLPSFWPSSALTIGNFDGVHRGHQELIGRVLKAAKRLQVAPVAFTFFPHPSRILSPSKPALRLFDTVDQRERLELMGLQALVVQEFDSAFAQVSAEDFFRDYLLTPLKPKVIIIGHDFAFGARRRGDHEFLKRACAEHGIELEIVPPVLLGGAPVSSTRIREALSRGDVEDAAQLLGRPYYLKGIVLAGEARGRTIGVPTANLRPLVEYTPKIGVYVSRTHVGTQTFPSVTNIGTNPTFHSEPDAPLRVETHLFDFGGDLYGRDIRVELLRFLRPEKRFAGLEELKSQIHLDLKAAREHFNGSN